MAGVMGTQEEEWSGRLLHHIWGNKNGHHNNNNDSNDSDESISRADIVFAILYVVLLLLIYMAALLLRHYHIYWHFGGRSRPSEAPIPLGREEERRRREEGDEEQGMASVLFPQDIREPHNWLIRLSSRDQQTFLSQLLPIKTIATKEDLASLVSSSQTVTSEPTDGSHSALERQSEDESQTTPAEAVWKDEDDDDDVNRNSRNETQHSTDSSNSPLCAICLNDFEVGEEIVMEPKCHHAFHATCIHAWLKKSCVCPTCRTSLYTQRDVYDYWQGKNISRSEKGGNNNGNKT